jgi:hypothetical protein
MSLFSTYSPFSLRRGVSYVLPLGEPGEVYSLIMAADASKPNNSADIWNSATGAKEFTIQALTTIATGEAVIVGWSTTSGDTDLETAVAAAVVSHGTPAGTEYPNQGILSLGNPVLRFRYDPSLGQTIKRIAVQSTSATTIVLAVQYVA